MREANAVVSEALKETKRSNELDKRAWVLVSSLDLLVDNTGVAAVRLTLKNPGRMPAQNVVVRLDTSDRPPEQFGLNVNERWSLIGPGESVQFPVPLNITAGQLADVRQGRRKLFVFGAIGYVDPFSEARDPIYHPMTTYCAEYSTAVHALVFCARGNRAS